jgi:hypothetical protein
MSERLDRIEKMLEDMVLDNKQMKKELWWIGQSQEEVW